MATEFKLPDLGEGLSEATLVGWKVKEGDTVHTDQVLAEVETDKATSELPSPFSGKIVKLHWKDGDTVPVGAALVTFESAQPSTEKRDRAAPAAAADKADGKQAPKPPPIEAKRETAKAAPQEDVERPVLAAPATRKLARERGIDLRLVHGTGPGGRITVEDVHSYAASPSRRRGEAAAQEAAPASEPPAPFPRPMLPDFSQWGEVERQKATAIRRRIAQRMILATQTAASVTHMDEADVSMLEESRAKAKDWAEEHGVRLTLLPYVIKALVAALKRRPIFNASYDEDKQEIVLKKYFHIGVAVDSPQGLLVPVVRDADRKTIADIAKDIVTLAERAREGKLTADQMRGGSFTVTNIGGIGGTAFTPILNWPEVAILGLARLQDRPAVQNGALAIRKKLPLMLTFDHRLIDGAEAARFVNDIKQFIENPLLLLLEH